MARVAHWFRTDLRLHDNIALKAALAVPNIEAFYPIWCWDPQYVYATRVGSNRWRFLLESMQNVSDSITKLQPESQMFVIRGSPLEILPLFFKACKITHLAYEKDDDEYTMARDEAINRLAEAAGVQVLAMHGHTLWEGGKVIKLNKGKTPTTYAQYQKLVSQMNPPARPLAVPDYIPPPGELDFTEALARKPDVDAFRLKDVNEEHREREKEDIVYESIAGPGSAFAVPTMEELAMQPATSWIRGGETLALERLEMWFTERKVEAAKFEKPKTSPASYDPIETTVLSPYLKFGCLSIRTFYWRIMDLYAEMKGKHSQAPVSLEGQIMFRDFFHCAQSGTPNFQRIRGNTLCKFLDWDLRNQYDEKGEQLKDLVITEENEQAWERFLAWKEGRTGYPWIDAQMRRLRLEGWMHHLGRHSVACFLTRQMYISWERGAEVFDMYLVDWDPASNSANWMWLSASAFFSQYHRMYSPIAFGQKWDKEGNFIRRYVPELKDFPAKYIYSPWLAPAEVQKKAKCIIGKDYPQPIVDDKESKATGLARVKRSYEAHIYGNDPKVLDGTAAEFVRSFGDLDIDHAGGKRKSREELSDERKGVKQTKLSFG